MVFQHPLAYLLGLQGVALLRSFAGDYDREFVTARLAEIRVLLDEFDGPEHGAVIQRVAAADGYDGWAPSYDEPGNAMIDTEEPLVRDILDGLPPGVALDAACGTGRHSAYLAARGHKVIGIDSSTGMLTVARGKVLTGEFREGDLHRLPVPDQCVDLVVCALALSHVPDVAPVLAEFVRVLRPGGHLVISDSRAMLGNIAAPIIKSNRDGIPGMMPNYAHATSDYLAAALRLDLRVRRCIEPRRVRDFVDQDGVPPGRSPASKPAYVPGHPPNVWALHSYAPTATRAAYLGQPLLIVWHFQVPSA